MVEFSRQQNVLQLFGLRLVYTCPEDQFRCGSGVCLDNRRRCDGYPDCPDSTDEHNCPGAGPGPTESSMSRDL